MEQDRDVKKWLSNNSWNLLVTFTGIVLAFAYLNARVMAVEEKIKDYPSQDWFELKFQNIDQGIFEIKEGLETHIKDTQ